MEGPIGSSRLLQSEKKMYKFGSVNITKEDIREKVNECMKLVFHPVIVDA